MWYCTAGTASQNSPGLMRRTRLRTPRLRASARAGKDSSYFGSA